VACRKLRPMSQSPASLSSQPIVLAACPLCGGSQARELAVFPELTWVRCDCSLIYKRSEQPDPAAAEFYESGYFGAGEQGRRYTQRTRRRIQKSRNQIRYLVAQASPQLNYDRGS